MTETRSPWPAVIGRLAIVLLVFALLGWLVNHLVLGMLVGTTAYLAWNLYNQVLLERWLREGRKLEPPDSRGLWGAIFNGIYRLQKRQRRRRKRLATILQGVRETINAMPDGAVILHDNGEIQWWNGAARDLLSLTWPQDEGQRIDNLLRQPEFGNFIREHHAGASSITVPSPDDDSQMLEIRVIPYGNKQRLMLVRDVSRLYLLERMRRDFVANISHELRTPLTVIHGVSETLSDSVKAKAPDAERPLELIQQQTRRMQRLVEDLLMLSRLETDQKPVERQLLDMPRILSVIVDEARALAQDQGHHIELECDPAVTLYGDESELRSALSNLVFNAVKYTPKNGRILVSWREDAGGARFTVEDNGIGIPAHHLPRLTERFYRVDSGRSSRTGGTGLGLAIVKHVLGRYQANLEVRSEPGKGSTFSCRFPPAVTARRVVSLTGSRSG